MKKSRRALRRLPAAVLLLALFFLLDYWLYPRFAQPAPATDNGGENGLWLRYTWYFGDHDTADIRGLADRLKRHGIRDAFFHVRDVDRQGLLRFHNPTSAEALCTELHALDPSVQRIAWIYVDKSRVDLSSSSVRKNLVSEAEWLVKTAGFDGIQWDYEVCPDGDRPLLSLLDETRATLPGRYLGVATPGWYPAPFGDEGWSADYFHEVAKRCDGIAVMAYDSGMLTPRSYVWWVGRQVTEVTHAITGTGCRLLVGLPTYGSGTLSHNAYAENLRLALIGVRDGLANHPDLSAWQGVSLFADYTTTAEDWREFDRLWPNSTLRKH